MNSERFLKDGLRPIFPPINLGLCVLSALSFGCSPEIKNLTSFNKSVSLNSSKLVFAIDPSSTGTMSAPLLQQPVIQLQSPSGAPQTSFSGTVTINLFSDSTCSTPSGVSVTGNTSTASSGSASFPSLAVGSLGSYYIQATIGSNATSCIGPIEITNALILTPAKANVAVTSGSQAFTAAGGVPPYTFTMVGGGAGGSVSGSGGTGTYTAAAVLGKDTVQVTDSVGNVTTSKVGNLKTDWNYSSAPGAWYAASKMVSNASGSPTVFYTSGSNQYVAAYNGSTWNTLGVALSPPHYSFGTIAVAVDSSGNPWVAFEDSSHSWKITVDKWNGSSWSVVGTAGFATNTTFTPFSLSINKTNTPYITFQDSTQSNKASTYTWNGTMWVVVGSAGYSPGTASGISQAFDNSGNLYVGISDQMSYPGGTIMAWNGVIWSTLGSADYFAINGSVGVTNIAFDSSNTPYVCFLDGSNVIQTYSWNGSNWVSLGGNTASGTAIYGFGFVLDSSGAPLISFPSAVSSGSTTIRWSGSSWQSFGGTVPQYVTLLFMMGNTYAAVAGEAGAGSLLLYGLDSSSSGSGAVAWTQTTPQSSTAANAQWTPSYDVTMTDQQIQYYSDEKCGTLSGSPVDLNSTTTATDGTTGTAGHFLTYRTFSMLSSGAQAWSNCSSEMGIRSIWSYVNGYSSANNLQSFVLDSTGIPIALSSTSSNTTNIARWNGSAWVNYGSSINASGVSLALDSTNNPWVAFTDTTNSNKVTVMKWTGAAWNLVGTPTFISTSPSLASFVLSSSNQPYVFYYDGSGGSVMTYDGSSWNDVGAQDFSVNSGSMALDPSGHPWVSFMDTNNGNHPTVMKWDGVSWVNVGSAGFGTFTANVGTSLVFDSSGNPYVTYVGDYALGDQQGLVVEWNGSSWSQVGTSQNGTQEIEITFDSGGNLWAAYNSIFSGEGNVVQWNGSSWVNVGIANFTGWTGYLFPNSIQVSSSGTAYLLIDGNLRRYDP